VANFRNLSDIVSWSIFSCFRKFVHRSFCSWLACEDFSCWLWRRLYRLWSRRSSKSL